MRTKGQQEGRKSLGGQAGLGRTRKYALGNPKRTVDGRGGQSRGWGRQTAARERDALWDAAGQLGGQRLQEFTLEGCFMEEMKLVNSLIKSIFIQQFFFSGRQRGGGACAWHRGDSAC